MWAVYKSTLGSVWGLLGIIVGVLALMNLTQVYMNVGIEPVIVGVIDTYRTVFHTGIDYLFVWVPFELSNLMKDVLTVYLLLVSAGVRLEMLERQSSPNLLSFNPLSFLYRFFVGYPMLIALPASVIITFGLFAIDPMAFLSETPQRLGIEDNQVALFLGALLLIGGFGNSFKQFKSDFWDDKDNRKKLIFYSFQLAAITFMAFIFVVVSSGM